jgi:hypothetical protein
VGQAVDVDLQEVPHVSEVPVKVHDALCDFVGGADVVGPGRFYQGNEVASFRCRPAAQLAHLD